jgi:hypothetical protein
MMIKYIYFLVMMMCCSISYSQTNIMLVSLPDKDTIDYKYPVFNWYYASTPDGRDNVRYNYVLTELQPGQSALTGVTVNQPLLRVNGIEGFQLVYPFDAPELQFNKRYGWQLEKTVNSIIVEKSEAWEFTLYKEVIVPAKYAVLNSDYNSTVYAVEGDGFYFKVQSRYPLSGNPKCMVLNEAAEYMDVQFGEDQKPGSNEEPEKTGRNFHYLRTDAYPTGTYTLIVKDPKGNEYNTRFRIN